jgi:hypothetical protein
VEEFFKTACSQHAQAGAQHTADQTEHHCLTDELAGDIRRGTCELAVLVAAEATGTAKRARKAGVALDWSLPSDTAFDNRLSTFPILSRTEIRHGIISMPLAYSLIENARRMELGLSDDAYAQELAALWSAFSAKAQARTHAQFPGYRTPDAMLGDDNANYPLTDIYRRWHVAQDAVDLGGAIILTSAGKARDMGVPQDKWVWLAGAAEAAEPPLAERGVIDLKVFYTWGNAPTKLFDKKFGIIREWDIPLTEGYDFEMLHNFSPLPDSNKFLGIFNLNLQKVNSLFHHMNLKILFEFK